MQVAKKKWIRKGISRLGPIPLQVGPFQLHAGEHSASAPADFPDDFPADFPDDFPADFPDDFPDDFPADFPDDFPADFPDDFLDDLPPLGLTSDIRPRLG